MLQVYQNLDFENIRISGTAEKPLSCLLDVCKALNRRAKHVRERFDDRDVSTDTITDSFGREQVLSVINKDGLYDVIGDLRKSKAKKFRKRVTSEVLPHIRKSCCYMVTNKPTSFLNPSNSRELKLGL